MYSKIESGHNKLLVSRDLTSFVVWLAATLELDENQDFLKNKWLFNSLNYEHK